MDLTVRGAVSLFSSRMVEIRLYKIFVFVDSFAKILFTFGNNANMPKSIIQIIDCARATI